VFAASGLYTHVVTGRSPHVYVNQRRQIVARPRPTALLPPRFYGKPEAASAVDRLLMIGKRMPETC